MTDISEEYKRMLRQLHEEARPERQPGEFTIDEYAELNKLTRNVARNELNNLFRSGKLEKPPKRYIGDRKMVVYKQRSA